MNFDKSKNKKSLVGNLKSYPSQLNSYFYNIGKPVWMERNYQQFAQEAYTKNVVAYRAINMIAGAAASIGLKVFDYKGHPIENHPIIELLYKPNPHQNKSEFLESVYLYRLISGNAYVFSASDTNKLPKEIYSLRPDRVNVIAGDNFLPIGYQYKVDKREQVFPVDQIHGLSRVLHIKNSNPISDWYGLSAIEAAAYSIDQHNNAAAWNQALLQNGARPSGAIIVKGADGRPSELSDEQFGRLKEMIAEDFTGSVNAGRPMILEGGLDWKEISLSPKDMDFIEGKHSAARDIALAFGVPPQLLGIPGDNTYSNLAEARVAIWEQTILPLAENTIDHIGRWLAKLCKNEVVMKLDKDKISALASKREAIWERLEKVSFMTINEKRKQVGLAPIKGGDAINTNYQK
ncbi:phage portal protein [Candidatus Bandiella numerosa]|uniref:phage portal protein n=1 Tax=Candidatus Bandiella numerosa TaxID=2570586 RepID=UPI00249DC3FE|nr:phage portal protein [Candidatus Bandiella numerosa]WHA05597.1 phage portal protein [Candidatus Bandiella numerosa]